MQRKVDPNVKTKLQGISGWRGINNPWMPEDDGDMDFAYINLLENVERYTGYKVFPVIFNTAWHLRKPISKPASLGRQHS